MKKLLLIILIIINVLAYSQDTTFNKLLNIYPGSNIITSIIKNNNYYYCSIANIDTTGQNCGVFKTNENFEVIDSNILYLNTVIVERFGIGFVLNNIDTSMLFVGSIKNDSIRYNGYIVKLNKDLDTIWTKQILHPDTLFDNGITNPITSLKDVRITPSGDYLIVGNYNHQCQGVYNNTFFIKMDTDGNIIWQKFLDPNIYTSYVTNIEIDPIDSSFYFLCATNPVSGNYFALYKYDKDGNYQWRTSTQNTTLTAYISKIKLVENQIIVATNYYKLPVENGDPMLLYVASIDKQTRNVNWVKKYNSIRIYSQYLRQEVIDIEETSSGNIAIGTVGYSYNDSLGHNSSKDFRAQLILLDSNGDSIWSRYYSYLEDEREIKMQFNDIVVCDDGGFLLGGSCYRPIIEPNYTRAWLAKTDSNGYCPGSFSVSIKEDELLIKHSGLVVYPNPTSNDINLRFEESTSQIIDVEIYNSSGKLVKQEQVSPYVFEQKININELPKGVYIVKLYSADGLNYSQKIIKN